MITAAPRLAPLGVTRLVRHALQEERDLTAAIEVLADRVDRLTAELAEGKLRKLTTLAAHALRALEAHHHEGGVA
jgi:histone H3/H4